MMKFLLHSAARSLTRSLSLQQTSTGGKCKRRGAQVAVKKNKKKDKRKESDVKLIMDAEAWHWAHPAPPLALNSMHGNWLLASTEGEEKPGSVVHNQQMSVLYFSWRNEGRGADSGTRRSGVSLQCNAEHGTTLTPNLSHSPLSSSPRGPRHGQKDK